MPVIDKQGAGFKRAFQIDLDKGFSDHLQLEANSMHGKNKDLFI